MPSLCILYRTIELLTKGETMIDPIVHAALVTLAVFVIKWLASLAGVNLEESTYTELAGLLVAYILSLFGYGVYVRATVNTSLANTRWYKPPLT